MVQFGTPREVLFASGLALDFEDNICLENSDGSLNTQAEIVALQLYEGHTAVAARFLGKKSADTATCGRDRARFGVVPQIR